MSLDRRSSQSSPETGERCESTSVSSKRPNHQLQQTAGAYRLSQMCSSPGPAAAERGRSAKEAARSVGTPRSGSRAVPSTLSPGAAYEALADDGEPECLAWLAVDEVKGGFRAAFPDIADDGTELNWEGAGSHLQVTWPVGSKPGHNLGVLITCGWSLLDQPAVIERLRSVGWALGCGMFDPQSGEWLS